jgi:hypothetical protein
VPAEIVCISGGEGVAAVDIRAALLEHAQSLASKDLPCVAMLGVRRLGSGFGPPTLGFRRLGVGFGVEAYTGRDNRSSTRCALQARKRLRGCGPC